MKTELYYSETENALRILYPDGKVEALQLGVDFKWGWFFSLFTEDNAVHARKGLKAAGELVCIIEESV